MILLMEKYYNQDEEELNPDITRLILDVINEKYNIGELKLIKEG